VCAASAPWAVLEELARRGLEVERVVQSTGAQPTDTQVRRLRRSWKDWGARASAGPAPAWPDDALARDMAKTGVKAARALDPSFLLLEATEYSHCQQSGDEQDGLGRPVDDPDEDAFYRRFRRGFGPHGAVFLQRIPARLTRRYDMYHCALELSSERLFRRFGCGNWTLYDLAQGRHGVDFRRLFLYSAGELLAGARGLDLCLRPTTPPMGPDQIRTLERNLWPVERWMPAPPRLESCTLLPSDPVACPKGPTARVDCLAHTREHTLFVNPVQWQTTVLHADGTRSTIAERFQSWAASHGIAYRQETLAIHAHLGLIVLRCTVTGTAVDAVGVS